MARTPESFVRLGLVQHAAPSLDKAKNLAKATAMIRQAAAQGATLVATQELFLTSYFCQVEDEKLFALAEPIPGPTSARLGDLARELGIFLSASLFEKRAPGLFHNTSILLNPSGDIAGKYRKMHIPDDPRFSEKYYFTPGDLGWSVLDAGACRAGLLVCWDQWYPEAARLTAMQGAQVLFYPTAIGWHESETPHDREQQIEAWRIIQRSHAIANGVFVAAINRVGVEGELEFWGSSFVADPGGVVIAQASGREEQVLLADCDLTRIDRIRQGWPFFRDRRIDAYQGLTRRYGD